MTPMHRCRSWHPPPPRQHRHRTPRQSCARPWAPSVAHPPPHASQATCPPTTAPAASAHHPPPTSPTTKPGGQRRPATRRRPPASQPPGAVHGTPTPPPQRRPTYHTTANSSRNFSTARHVMATRSSWPSTAMVATRICGVRAGSVPSPQPTTHNTRRHYPPTHPPTTQLTRPAHCQ